MKRTLRHLPLAARARGLALGLAVLLLLAPGAAAQPDDPLPSWNEGPAKQAIIALVEAVSRKSSPQYVPPGGRIAAFDNDGTMWVEHPNLAQRVFLVDRLRALAPQHPEWQYDKSFKAVLDGGLEALAGLPYKEQVRVMFAIQAGVTITAFRQIVRQWLATAKDPRFHRPYTELVYLPMLEAMRYLRAHGFATYIVTGGGQEFVRAYAPGTYGLTPAQVVGSILVTSFTYEDGRPVLQRQPRIFFIDNRQNKPVGINLFAGQQPLIAFGNSTGDREMLEWTTAGDGARLGLLVHHDDPKRAYAYGPAGGLPDTSVGRFPPSLMEEAKKRGWVVISMKKDWKKIFSWEGQGTAPEKGD